jgi:hypothetical protein
MTFTLASNPIFIHKSQRHSHFYPLQKLNSFLPFQYLLFHLHVIYGFQLNLPLQSKSSQSVYYDLETSYLN